MRVEFLVVLVRVQTDVLHDGRLRDKHRERGRGRERVQQTEVRLMILSEGGSLVLDMFWSLRGTKLKFRVLHWVRQDTMGFVVVHGVGRAGGGHPAATHACCR